MTKIPDTFYCPHCDMFLDADTVKNLEDNDPTCTYCNQPAQFEPDPEAGPYDTYQESWM